MGSYIFGYFSPLVLEIWDIRDAREQAVSSSGTEMSTEDPGRQDHRAKAADYALFRRVLWKPHRGAADIWNLYP